jgi:SAM-dependent methyltransferase
MFPKMECPKAEIPLSGAKWAARAEAYAAMISEHLSPSTVWLDAGCGRRLLEDDMDRLEDWLVDHCGRIVGLDASVTTHRNINLLVQGTLYALPFADSSLDLVTCNMVVEHLDKPGRAFAEIARCLRPGGAVVVITPNLLNYGILGNAVASRVMPEELRLRLVRSSDSREPKDIFPVRYKANTMRGLVRLFNESGFDLHRAVALPQRQPFLPKTEKLEKLLMKLTPFSGLLVCAHKRSAMGTAVSSA